LQEVARTHGPRGAALQVIEGNLLVPEDCSRAVAGASIIFHLAAGIDSSFAGCFMNSVLTTRNLLDAALRERTLRRLVNVSSFAVYSNRHMKRRALLDESAPVENQPQLREDPYAYAKLKQEQLVQRYHSEFGVPYVIVRPGAVYGPGKSTLSGRIGIDTFGVFLHLGGTNTLPLTYVDNCADAIVLAGVVAGVEGEVFNVIDDELPTSRRFLSLYKRYARRFVSVPVPYRIAYVLSSLWEDYSRWSAGQLPPRFNRTRCAAEWKGNRYSNAKLKRLLGWQPRVSFEQGSSRFFDSVRARV
jgi:nucleoside-diphosphate-sugar epimerase